MSEHKGPSESRGNPSHWLVNPESLQSVLDAAPVLVAVAGLDGYYKYVNQAFERILGYSREESLSRPFLEFIHPEDREAARTTFAKLASGEAVVQFEDRNVCKDGSSRWINWTVVPQMDEGLVYGIGHDVTLRKRAENDLRDEQQRFQTVFENASVGIALVDPAGHVIAANDADLRFLGYSRGELIGRHFSEFTHPEDLELDQDLFESMSRAERPGYSIEKRYVRKDGEVVWGRLHIAAVRQLQGQLKYSVVVCEDITERRQFEQQLREAHEKLERRVRERTAELSTANDKLRAEIEERARAERQIRAEQAELRESLLSRERDRRLIACEIHDGLAQQLVGAKMHLEAYRLQRERRPEQAEQNLQECLDLLVHGVQESRNLIQGLRPPDLDGLGLVPAIRHIADDAGKAGLPVEVDSDLGDDRLPGRIEDTVYRIVQEGLTNARVHSGSDRAWVRLRRTEGWLRIEIRDRGCGFDPEAVREGFHGLRGARQRVRVFGGTFTIESRVGEGTRLVVVLPVDPSEQENSLG